MDNLDVPVEVEKEGKGRLSCPLCNKTYSKKFTLDRHMKHNHSDVISQYPQEIVPSGVCPLCDAYVRHGDDVILHLQEAHEVDVEVEELHFNSTDEFNLWKDKMCNETLTQFSKVRGDKEVTEGQRVFLNCHRSGKFHSRGKDIRYRNPEKIVKTGKVCPSRLVVTTTLRGIFVTFYKTHVGHINSIEYLRFTQSEREEIAGTLSTDVPMKVILDRISSRVPNHRRDAIDVQDLYNIIRDFNLDTDKGNKDDAVSVNVWVEQQQCLGDETPVHFYKRQGDIDTDNGLEENDFLLVLMTPYQKKMLRKFACRRILIDSTHGTNQYDFLLTTLMSVDEFGAGVPLAFCISNKIDQNAMKAFFTSVKDATGFTVETEVFMSDDFPAYFNAWCDVMEEPIHQLLCLWHVQKNWKTNLKKTINNKMKQAEVYRGIQVLLVEMNEEVFYDALDGFLALCRADEETQQFGEYFEEYYASRPKMWAFAFRKGLRLNTNMYLEAMHKKLKYLYLDGKTNRRLDKCIAGLLRFSLNMMHDRFLRLIRKKPTYRMKTIMRSHRESLTITEEMTETIQENVWHVKSSGNNEIYKIVMDENTQCRGCPLSCWVCKVCVHKFACTCKDYIIRGNFCKHIHACLRLKGYTADDTVELPSPSDPCTETLMEEMEAMAEAVPPKQVGEVLNQRQKLTTLMTISQGVASQLGESSLPKAIKGVEHLLENLKALERQQTGNTNEENRTTSRPRRIERQPRLYSTRKKKTQTTNTLTKPSEAETVSLRDTFLGKDALVINSSSDHTYVPH